MKKNISGKEALKIIVDAAKNYDLKLKDKHFLIVYQEENQIKTACVGFRDMNFLHLTGVKTKLSAQLFYSAAISGKLSEKNFSLDTKGKAQQKLAVLPFLHELFYHNCMIGDFINSGIYIKADYFVGDTKAVLSVGFRYGKKADMPVTLYNENVKTLSRPIYKVLEIFVKEYKETMYSTCTYLSKGQSMDKLRLPDDISEFVDLPRASLRWELEKGIKVMKEGRVLPIEEAFAEEQKKFREEVGKSHQDIQDGKGRSAEEFLEELEIKYSGHGST